MLNKIKNASLAAAMALSMTVLTAGQAQAAAPHSSSDNPYAVGSFG